MKLLYVHSINQVSFVTMTAPQTLSFTIATVTTIAINANSDSRATFLSGDHEVLRMECFNFESSPGAARHSPAYIMLTSSESTLLKRLKSMTATTVEAVFESAEEEIPHPD